MTQDKITAKQEEILQYIKDTILKKGYPPPCGRSVRRYI